MLVEHRFFAFHLILFFSSMLPSFFIFIIFIENTSTLLSLIYSCTFFIVFMLNIYVILILFAININSLIFCYNATLHYDSTRVYSIQMKKGNEKQVIFFWFHFSNGLIMSLVLLMKTHSVDRVRFYVGWCRWWSSLLSFSFLSLVIQIIIIHD